MGQTFGTGEQPTNEILVLQSGLGDLDSVNLIFSHKNNYPVVRMTYHHTVQCFLIDVLSITWYYDNNDPSPYSTNSDILTSFLLLVL